MQTHTFFDARLSLRRRPLCIQAIDYRSGSPYGMDAENGWWTDVRLFQNIRMIDPFCVLDEIVQIHGSS